jgi:hypothetical protein
MWGNAGQVGVPIQAKLTIGEVGDKYEQEADRVARDVVQRINQPQTVPPKQEEKVQRQEVPEEEIQMKSLRVPQEAIAGREASTDLDTAINSARGGGQALDEGLQRSIGQAMGADFSGVKVHTDSQADQLNKSIQAKAFTTGQDVFFRQGAYEPGSRGGQELIAHELTHVVQQSGSAVQRKLSQIDYGASVVQRAWEKGKYGVYIWDKELDGLTWYTQGSDLWFDITDESSIKFDIPKDYELYLQLDSNKSQKKSLEEWQSLGLVVPPDILAQAPPDILAQVPHILKFNFAGSGQVAWKTHYGKYPDSEKKQMESANHQFGGKKYAKEKPTWGSNKKVFEYAGPISKLFGKVGKKGLKDSGKNSTEVNLEDAKNEFNSFMIAYRIGWVARRGVASLKMMPKVQIKIKGFSRGAATASVFANWIKNDSFYGELVDVNLVVIDPVHGTGVVGKGRMDSEQDVSGIYDEKNAPEKSGTTYLMPIESGHARDWFTPQHLSKYQRIIIGYGNGIKHSFGLGESTKSTLKYNGIPVKGMKLSTLPKGLFVVDAANMEIIKIESMEIWKAHEKDILGKANKKERRDVIIHEAVAEFLDK